MRAAHWIVVGLLVIAAVMMTHWFTRRASWSQEAAVPGQYPLNHRRPEWPATESVGLYRPRSGQWPQDALKRSGHRDAKQLCGDSRFCDRPSVSEYRPTLLEQTTVP